MQDIESWNHRSLVIEFLAKRLNSGHILPFLGSGVSYFANLPNWQNLLSDIGKEVDPDYVLPDDDPYVQAEHLLSSGFHDKTQEFYKAVHSQLFAHLDSDFLDVIRADEGMRALTMLCHRSVRGGSNFIATLNYDDILELMLNDLSLVVHSVGSDRFLLGSSDVTVLHPHGLLRLEDKGKDLDRRIVIAQSDHSHVKDSSWFPMLTVLLSKSFPLFIGIGGKDLRFLDYLDEARKYNYSTDIAGLPYVGIRLCSRTDAYKAIFEKKKIKCIDFEDLGRDWPTFVAAVCRKAAEIARERIHSI
ncbi:SIR2 family protein [Agrobacterium sp. lyk4-40-TYG-31]|uniref:SIR2 family protein n=1 Tax=Agrobacterium sp. lyk4-40-TYG-31 TaxID=3040276 RepID=UPI00254C83B1|nr:SIR2 family protein [Agrobacterium sp. lyk4-40-TYG-31]